MSIEIVAAPHVPPVQQLEFAPAQMIKPEPERRLASCDGRAMVCGLRIDAPERLRFALRMPANVSRAGVFWGYQSGISKTYTASGAAK